MEYLYRLRIPSHALYAYRSLVSSVHRRKWRRCELLVWNILGGWHWPVSFLDQSDEQPKLIKFRITACVVYYYVWIDLIPKYKGYEFRQTVVEYEDGSIAHQLVKVPKTELAIWDAQHDSTGRSLTHI